MSDGTGYVLYRRAFCLLWKALYHFQLPALESAVFGANSAQGQREVSRILSGCQSIGYRVKVSGVVALCHMLVHFHAINQVT